MNCQRRILAIRWVHFVKNASVTSQTGKEGLAIRICRRRLSIFGHVRRLPEATPAHSALRLAVNRTSGRRVEAPSWTTLPNVGAADQGRRHWAQRQRRLEDRSWPQVLEGATMDPWPVKRSSEWVSEWVVMLLAERNVLTVGSAVSSDWRVNEKLSRCSESSRYDKMSDMTIMSMLISIIAQRHEASSLLRCVCWVVMTKQRLYEAVAGERRVTETVR